MAKLARREAMPIRIPPGLGNIVEAVVSAAAVAIATRRILLIEGWPTASIGFGPPLSELIVETPPWILGDNGTAATMVTADRRTARGNRSLHTHSNRSTRLPSTRSWQARLNLAQPPGSSRFDTFASHDGLSAAPLFCKAALPHEPSAKVWRIMSNESSYRCCGATRCYAMAAVEAIAAASPPPPLHPPCVRPLPIYGAIRGGMRL